MARVDTARIGPAGLVGGRGRIPGSLRLRHRRMRCLASGRGSLRGLPSRTAARALGRYGGATRVGVLWSTGTRMWGSAGCATGLTRVARLTGLVEFVLFRRDHALPRHGRDGGPRGSSRTRPFVRLIAAHGRLPRAFPGPLARDGTNTTNR